MENKLPPVLEMWLDQLGVRKPIRPVDAPERTYTFRTPIFDENGEPNF